MNKEGAIIEGGRRGTHFPMYFYGSGIAQVIVYSIGVSGVALPFVIWFMICYKSFLDVSKISHNPKKDK